MRQGFSADAEKIPQSTDPAALRFRQKLCRSCIVPHQPLRPVPALALPPDRPHAPALDGPGGGLAGAVAPQLCPVALVPVEAWPGQAIRRLAVAMDAGAIASTGTGVASGPGPSIDSVPSTAATGCSATPTTPCPTGSSTSQLDRRSKPVRKQRFIPAEKAYAFARKLQGQPGCTVSVC